MEQHSNKEDKHLDKARFQLLDHIEAMLEGPMIILGFVWLALIVMELVRGLSPFLQMISTVIWVIFLLDFVIKFVLAPSKKQYLKSNWLAAVSLAIPALRFLRFFRGFQVVQSAKALHSIRLAKIVTSLNRGMGSLRVTMKRRAFGYVFGLTIIVILTGAAGMYAFESSVNKELGTYSDNLWWTAMLMTSIGSEAWPKSPEGKVLCLLLSLYGFAVFGYFTAFLASFFTGMDTRKKARKADDNQLGLILEELAALRTEISLLRGGEHGTASKNE